MLLNRRVLIATGAMALGGATSGQPLAETDRLDICISPPGSGSAGAIRSAYIPMPDGVRLAVDIVLPEALEPGQRLPTLLTMTRYWRGVRGAPPDADERLCADNGFACVVGDVRGTGASFGEWRYHRSRAETRDFSTVMDWIAAQPWSDGRIIGIGNSYSANTADWMAERNDPALKAIVPRFADYDPYEQLYFPGGVPNAFMGRTWGLNVKRMDEDVLRTGGRLSPGVRPVAGPHGERLLGQAIVAHGGAPSVWEGLREVVYRDDRPPSWLGASMDDWSIRTHAAEVEHAGTPIQNWAGWWDCGTAQGAIERFMLQDNPQRIMIGPWSHGGVHALDPFRLNAVIAPDFPTQQQEDLCFIRNCLGGDGPSEGDKALHYYVMGRGEWRSTRVWPLPAARMCELFLASAQSLRAAPAESGADSYRVDFQVGSGKATRWTTNNDGSPVDYPDRAGIDGRLLAYTGAPLVEDTEITGHPAVTLYVSSTHADGSFIVYLEAVSPAGRAIYLTEGGLRAIHRRVWAGSPFSACGPQHSFRRQDGAPLRPGQVEELRFTLFPVSVVVPAGFRIRIAIAGADADTFARVPAVGDPVITVHHGRRNPTAIRLPIIPA